MEWQAAVPLVVLVEWQAGGVTSVRRLAAVCSSSARTAALEPDHPSTDSRLCLTRTSSPADAAIFFNSIFVLFVSQEEVEAQMKADKIKLALEKLKEAKVKKVRGTSGETDTASTDRAGRPQEQTC